MASVIFDLGILQIDCVCTDAVLLLVPLHVLTADSNFDTYVSGRIHRKEDDRLVIEDPWIVRSSPAKRKSSSGKRS